MARNVRYVGIADDPDGSLPEPQFYIDASEVGLDSPNDTEMEKESSLGMTNRAKAPGGYLPTGNIVYDDDIGTMGYFYKKLLNGYAFTDNSTAATPDFNAHEAWATDQRDFEEFCTRVGKDEFEHVFEGCVATSLESSIESNGFVSKTINVNAKKDTKSVSGLKDVVEDIMPGLPAEFALPFHRVAFFIDEDQTQTAVDVSGITMSMSFGIDNGTDSERGITLGSRFTRRHRSPGRGFSLSAELDFLDTVQKEKFWGDVNGPSDFGAKYFPVKIVMDSGSDFSNPEHFGRCEIVFPRCYYSTVPTTYSGRDPMSNSVEIKVQDGGTATLEDGSTVVATPMYVKLLNRRADLT